MNARHDASYKHLFSSPKMVQHLVEGFIPDDWMKRLDFTTLEKVPASYVSDDLRERADDVLWRVKTSEDWLYLYFLIEFQSSVDPWMAVRMLTYVGLLYQDLIKGGRVQGRRLPPVLPIVFYTGEERWRAPTDLAELLPEHPPGILGNYLPRLAYFLVDENVYSDEVLASLQNAVAATIRLKRQETAEDIARLGAAMRAWFAGDPELQRILALWIREYLLRDLKPELDVPESYDLGEVTMQFAERIKEQMRQREQNALQQGLQKGVLQGEALALQRQLTRRFGPLPEWARQRLQHAAPDELETWLDRVLDAQRLEDVFGS